MIKKIEKLLKDKKNKYNVLVLGSVAAICILGVFAYLMLVPFGKKALRTPEEYPVLPQAYGFFNLVPVSGLSVSQGDLVNVRVDLTTSGEEFDAATAIVEWNEAVFGLENATPNTIGSADHYDNFLENSQNRYILAQWVTGEPYMQTASAPFYTLQFRVLQDLSGLSAADRTIKFSEVPDDLTIHFVGEAETNRIDQSRSTAPSLTFTAGIAESFGYFELEASNANQNYVISPGQTVDVYVDLYTSQDSVEERGELFDVATAIVEWPSAVEGLTGGQWVLEYAGDEEIDVPPLGVQEGHISTWIGGDAANDPRRMVIKWVETPANSSPDYMYLPIDSQKQIPYHRFYKFSLTYIGGTDPSLYNASNMTISLSTRTSDDESIHFSKYKDQEINSIDQSRASKTSITFKLAEPSPSPSPSPSVSPSPWPSPSPSPSVSPSPWPSPSPSPSVSPVPGACSECNLNGDNEIGYGDLVYLLNNWDNYPTDAFSLLICILYNWGTPCP